MQRVGPPAQLPGAEVLLPALFIEIGKDKEQQQGDNARYDDHTGGDVIHGSVLTHAFLGEAPSSWGFHAHVFTRHSRKTIGFPY